MPHITVVVPCHNEEQVLPLLFERVASASRSWGAEYDIVCVDDGSRDQTWRVIEDAAARFPHVHGVQLSRNFGQQSAIAAGMSFARGQAVVVIDADLQDPPEVVGELVRTWQQGIQVVHAVRTQRKDKLVKRVLASGFYRLLTSIAPFSIPRDSGEFVLLDRVVVDIMNALPEQDRYLRGLRAWCGFRQGEVVYKREARALGSPQYTFWKSLSLAIDGMVSFSTSPLRIASYLGAACVVLAVVGGLWDLAALVAHDATPFSATLLAVLLVGGGQLACLGIVGEYVGRIAQQVKGRPLWITRQTAGLSGAPVVALFPGGPSSPISLPRTESDERRP